MTASFSVAEDRPRIRLRMWREREIELGIDFVDAGGNFDMNGEAVEQVAAPLKSLPCAVNLRPARSSNGPVGRVLSGNPFRIVKSEMPRSSGNLQLRMKDLARRMWHRRRW